MLSVFTLLLLGCTPQGGDKELRYSDNYFPSEWKQPYATLRLANLEIPIELKLEAKGTERELQLINEGVVMEKETYRVTTEGIWLVRLRDGETGETFAPELPLLRFPMRVGEDLSWEGKLVIGTREIPSRAKIHTSAETITFETGVTEAVHVEVALELDDGSPRPAQRRLAFWFVKGEGPLKREYGTSGQEVREPRRIEKSG